MSDPKPLNKLEALLVRAATDAAARPDFYRELLRSVLFVLTPEQPRAEGATTLERGSTMSIVNFEGPSGPYTPIFSARERVEELAQNYGRRIGFLGIQGKDLFGVLVQQPHQAVLNPGFPYGKQFTPDEIRRIADESILRLSEPKNVQEGTQILLGQPAVYPQKLVDALTRLFRERPSVSAAYLAQVHVSSEPAPHPIIGIVSTQYEVDAADAGMVAQEIGEPSQLGIVDITRDPDGGIARYLREHTTPFWKRTLP